MNRRSFLRRALTGAALALAGNYTVAGEVALQPPRPRALRIYYSEEAMQEVIATFGHLLGPLRCEPLESELISAMAKQLDREIADRMGAPVSATPAARRPDRENLIG